MLSYEKIMLSQVLKERDSMVLVAKGISLERVLENMFHVFACETQLVFVLMATPEEERHYLEISEGEKISSVTTNVSAVKRRGIYAGGGVIFTSPTIILMDLLKKVAPIAFITGIIALRVHTVTAGSQLPFIVRLYREGNSTGFIKAFSDNPCSFLEALSKPDCAIPHFLFSDMDEWPRYHPEVNTSLTLSVNYPKVIETRLRFTPAMHAIHSNLFELIKWSVGEIQKIIPEQRGTNITPELALTENFEGLFSVHIDPIIGSIGPRYQRIIHDLSVLRKLIFELIRSDCATFYSTLCTYTGREAVLESPWVLSKECELIIKAARERLHADPVTGPELHEKWNYVAHLIATTIKAAERDHRGDGTEKLVSLGKKVIIFTQDVKSSLALRDFLCLGFEASLVKVVNEDPLLAKYTRIQDTYVQPAASESAQFLTQPIFISPMKLQAERNPFRISKVLSDLTPDIVIMVSPDLELVRKIEIHCARVSPCAVPTVHLLTFEESAEEHVYLHAIRKELEAFKHFAVHRPLKRGGLHSLSLVGAQGEIETRSEGKKRVILVDMREFRSPLASLLHSKGITLEPLTLDVGDYVLTDDICVERKSVSDLVSSLHSGRLYNQANAMTRHYRQPVLLIEQATNEENTNHAYQKIQSVMRKLVLFTMSFPKMKIIWSSGAKFTSEIFNELKDGKPEPDAVKAIRSLKESSGINASARKYSPVGLKFLSKMPGVDSSNLFQLMGNCPTLAHLGKMTKEHIESLVSNKEKAAVLFKGLHSNLMEKPKTM